MFVSRIYHHSARLVLVCALAMLVSLMVPGISAAQAGQKIFKSPEEAVKALSDAVSKNSGKDFLAIFGPGSKALFSSGDKVEDSRAREKFILWYGEKNRLENAGKGKVVLHIGSTDWPFPIPIVKSGRGWRFDTVQGLDELLSRRIGRNELAAIQTCLAIVDAQKEYASRDLDNDGLLEYAQSFASAKGKKDGLYWKPGQGDDPSPLGPLVARARSEGYAKGTNYAPYNGYRFRILKAQGKNAPGGKHGYLVKGKMVGGFAVVAYPAGHLVSGVKTFIVNHEGVVYEKDLGPETARLAQAMSEFDPDRTWKKVK